MAWFTRFTRFGDMHLVYGQEHNMSCGIASLLMCVFKLNKLKPGRTTLAMETNVIARYQALLGQAYDADQTGTYGDKLATILTGFTEGTWAWRSLPPADVSAALVAKVGTRSGLGLSMDVEPVILGVDWDSGGAHWIVVDTIRDVLGTKYATVCDPWDANVHMQKVTTGQPFSYDASTGGFCVNLWGTKPKGTLKGLAYDNGSKGQVKYWGMIART